MKNFLPIQKISLIRLAAIAILVFGSLPLTPTLARPMTGTITPQVISGNTTWTEANSPYLVDGFVHVLSGATLTIEAGVEVDNSGVNWPTYGITVYGTLKALGTAQKPIYFHNSSENTRWDGITIEGTPDQFNQGSSLEYVTLNHGGLVESGAGANLVLYYAQAEVHHCTFENGPGDGILGDDVGTGSYANVYDSSFINNGGYAINFEDGSILA